MAKPPITPPPSEEQKGLKVPPKEKVRVGVRKIRGPELKRGAARAPQQSETVGY